MPFRPTGGSVGVRRRSARWAAVLLVLVVAALTLTVTSASPAQACTCLVGTPMEELGIADAVFTGTIVSESPVGPADEWMNDTLGPGQAVQTVVRVDEVYKGSVARRQAVVHQEGMCANPLGPPGTRQVLVFADQQRSGVLANGCASGSVTAADLVDFPAARAPAPGADIPEEPPNPPWGRTTRVFAVATVLLVGLGIGATVWRRRAAVEPH